jgi:hypothetical protein
MRPRAILIPLLLAGCGYRLARLENPPIQPFGAPPQGAAQICILRPRYAPSGLIFAVHDNNKLVGATRGSSYFCYHAQPGPHRITSSRKGAMEEISLMAQAGGRYFVYQNVDPYPDANRSWLSLPSETEARSMIGDCAYRIVTSAPGEDPPGERPMAKADPSLRITRNESSPSVLPVTEAAPPPPPPPPPPVEPPARETVGPVIDAGTAVAPAPPSSSSRRKKRRSSTPSSIGGGSTSND